MDLIEASGSVPTKSELNQIRPGMFCRLGLTNGENFWAMCTSVERENKTFQGTIETDQDQCPVVKTGDAVVFQKCHVFEVV